MANPWEDFTPPAAQASPWEDFESPEKLKAKASQIPGGAAADQYSTPEPEPSFTGKLAGAGEAALQLGTALPGMVAGPLMGLQAATRGASPKEAEEVAARQMEAMSYEPRTKAGKEYSGMVGEAINKYLMPVLPMAHLPSIKAREGFTAAKAMLPERASPKAPVGGAKGLAAELAKPEPIPEAPKAPETLYADQRGVITPELPSEAMQLAKERASRAIPPEEIRPQVQGEMFPTDLFELTPEGQMAPKVAEAVRPEMRQAELFAPETNIHRPYTDIRAATEAGGERPLTPAEFAKVHENLAKEPATAHEVPPDMGVAYQKYLDQVSGKQTDMFDIGSRQEAFGKQAFAEQVARQLEEHPFVKKAEKELAKQEQFVADLKDQVASGETRATVLATEMKALEKAQEKVAAVRTNVETALTNKQKPSPFRGRGGKQAGALKIDWKDNNKVDALKKNVGFAESLKEVGHAQIKSPEEALSLAKTMPDVQQNIVQRGINALTKGGSYLKAKVNNPIVHFTVDRFLDADNKAKAEISEKLHGEYLGTLRSLSKDDRNQAFEILTAADLNKRTITPEMRARHGLSEPLQKFITTHQGMMADVLGKINAARAAVGKKPLEAREAYSAMNMTGDFRKVAYKVIDGAKVVVGVIGANSKRIGKKSLSNLEKLMKEKDSTLEFGPLQDMTKSRGSSKGTPHEAFTDALKTIGEDNPAFKEFLDTLAQVAKDDPSNYLGMQKHAMQKKGVWGMEGRKPWESVADNATAFFENQTRYMEGAYQWSHLAEAAKDVNAVIRDGEVVTKQPNAITLSEGYMQNALGLNPSRMGRAVNEAFNALFAPLGVGPSIPKAAVGVARQVANTFMLSMNVPFLAIQLLQPVIAMPGMLMYLKGRGMDVAGFAGPSKALITIHKIRAGKPLDAVEAGALKYAKENHVYATDMVEHTNQTQKGVGYYTSKITQTPAALAETGTRATVYLSLVHTLHEGGLTPAKGLYEQAQRFTDIAMNNYSAIEKPPIYNALGPLGTMAYNLKSFGHNEISRWSLFAREIPRTGNALPLLTQMATTIAFAGALGLPFMAQWESLYDFITKKMGSPRSLTLDIMKVSEQLGASLGEKGAHAFSNGLGALAGVDISSRVGLGDVLPSHASDAAFAGGGKLGQMTGALGGAIMSPSEETLKAAAINLAPPFMQGPMDLALYTKNDLAYSKDPSNLKPVARRNAADKLFKAVGLSGINESVQKQKTYQLGQLDKAYTDIRKSAMNTLTQDLFRNRPMLQKTLDKYFVSGQGDPKTFEQEISKKAMFMNLAPNELAILQNAASNSITKAQSLQRRTQ